MTLAQLLRNGSIFFFILAAISYGSAGFSNKASYTMSPEHKIFVSKIFIIIALIAFISAVYCALCESKNQE